MRRYNLPVKLDEIGDQQAGGYAFDRNPQQHPSLSCKSKRN